MKKLHKSYDRGIADFGWLHANYSFSFANYFNKEAVNFGALRVLNDDVIQGGMGFGMHPHENMEIITIPLKGSLKHKDSMSNNWRTLHTGEVQVMSAGSGIVHSEKNNSLTKELNLFQIWILSNKKNVTPSYNQKKFNKANRKNKLQYLVSSSDEKEETTLKIHQNALISRIDLDSNKDFEYILKSENYGVYAMVISGSVEIENESLSQRDAIEISQTNSFQINANTNAELLFIEVPMKF